MRPYLLGRPVRRLVYLGLKKKKCKIKNGSRRKPGKRFSNHCQVMLMYFPSAGQRSGEHDIKGQGTRGNELLATLLHVSVATANHTIA